MEILIDQFERIVFSLLLTITVYSLRAHFDPKLKVSYEWLCWIICVTPFVAWELFTLFIIPPNTRDLAHILLGAIPPTSAALANRIAAFNLR